MMITAAIGAGTARMAEIGAPGVRGVMTRKCPPSRQVASIEIANVGPMIVGSPPRWALPCRAMATTQHLSQAAFDRLKAEYDDLTTRGRVEIARKIEAARELGDLSENGDYHAAKEEQGKMEGRIRQLHSLIENAEIVEATADGGVVGLGSVVGIRYQGDDDVEKYLIGSIEERHDDLDVISPSSPLGEALLGSSAGDDVTFTAPTGADLKVTVVSID
jgi:transcription elongation factor GreA